ncbi:hypothetical protein CFP56_028704 [Quercus suber]|uniref:Uncharacterized protein n=1 Tax=Quercus suber TaxID=58331 RepID=A0AAW0LUR3_QUESU
MHDVGGICVISHTTICYSALYHSISPSCLTTRYKLKKFGFTYISASRVLPVVKKLKIKRVLGVVELNPWFLIDLMTTSGRPPGPDGEL